MLQCLAKYAKKPLVMGVDWQANDLRIVLVGRSHQLLGQWTLPLPMANAELATLPSWQGFIAQLTDNAAPQKLWIYVGLPNRCCTWVHYPSSATQAGKTQVNRMLQYQRMAASALNIEPHNLRVSHLQLAANFSFLVVINRHYEILINHFISHIYNQIRGSCVACIEPQGLTRVPAPACLDQPYAMAWYMATKPRHGSC
ncbi:MAG: hypothetical protein PSN46_05245 [Gammaproteobacteria bacterium]|nr:hypothetical protein [Gammaproteobacteria bacterium]